MGRALQALARVTHRGAAACDSSGDGAGVLTQIPARLFDRDPEGGEPFAVGGFFLPRDPSALALVTSIIEERLAGEGLTGLAWRAVPADLDVLGTGARATRPTIRQAITAPPGADG